MSYNYPFMISRHLNPRASGLIVFGGGGGDAPAAPAVDTTPEFQKTAQSFVSGAQASSDAGQDPGKWSHYENMVWSDGTEVGMIKNSVTGATQAGSGRLPQGNKQAIRDAVAQLLLTMNKPHEDWKAAKAEKEKLAKDADTATTTATDYAKNITDDVSGSAKEVQDKINTVSLELTRLKGEDQSNEAIAAQVKAKQEELVKLRRDAAAIASIEMAEQGQAAKKLVTDAVADPSSLVTETDVATIDADTVGTEVATGTGSVGEISPTAVTTTVDSTSTVGTPDTIDPSTITTAKVTDKVTAEADKVTAETGELSPEAKLIAAQGKLSPEALAKIQKLDPQFIKEVMAGTRKVSTEELAVAMGMDEEAVKTMIAEADIPDIIKAAQTTVKEEELPQPAKIAEDNMATAKVITMDGLTEDATATAAKLDSFSVDNGTLAEFIEGKVTAQDTVQGQLVSLMKQFDDGTPAWAAGAMRAANAAMAARGLGRSSMAGAAIVQAAMESAIPIASTDAQAFREMNMNNLGRQQQISLSNAAAQQGVQLNNFNAEQQAALQNSQNAFSLQSQNLSNMQSVMLANAQIKASLQGQNLNNQQQSNLVIAARYAEISNLNLNNRQQGLLQDSANNMQVNLANMSAKQQAYMANAQLEAALQGKQIDNQQQVALTNAARYSEANNLNFTVQEQAKLHNSELMKTIGLAELSSRQATTLQNASAIASMDMANLSARQQAAVQNAQAFLQMDMTNLSNRQQTSLFKAQAIQQAILTDGAAENAAKQFNAASENQTNQFMANLFSQTSQFNATQFNTTAMFNAGAKNAASQFNTQIKNQRDQFNAQNALVIAQANAQWRQNTVTLNTSAQNAANAADAQAANAFTSSVMDQLWQRERDIMDYSFKSSESAKQRIVDIMLADKKYDEYQKVRDDQEETNKYAVWTQWLLS